jgi:hypothetical protein
MEIDRIAPMQLWLRRGAIVDVGREFPLLLQGQQLGATLVLKAQPCTGVWRQKANPLSTKSIWPTPFEKPQEKDHANARTYE